jgi:membrane-associated phospholipid phosphatase
MNKVSKVSKVKGMSFIQNLSFYFGTSIYIIPLLFVIHSMRASISEQEKRRSLWIFIGFFKIYLFKNVLKIRFAVHRPRNILCSSLPFTQAGVPKQSLTFPSGKAMMAGYLLAVISSFSASPNYKKLKHKNK